MDVHTVYSVHILVFGWLIIVFSMVRHCVIIDHKCMFIYLICIYSLIFCT